MRLGHQYSRPLLYHVIIAEKEASSLVLFPAETSLALLEACNKKRREREGWRQRRTREREGRRAEQMRGIDCRTKTFYVGAQACAVVGLSVVLCILDNY